MPGAISPAPSGTPYRSAGSLSTYTMFTGVTLVADRPYLIRIANGGVGSNSALVPTSVTSTTGHTWTLVDSVAHSTVPNRRESLYVCDGIASPVAGNIVANFAVAQGYCHADRWNLQGARATSPVVQHLASESANTPVSAYNGPTLNPLANGNNVVMAFWEGSTLCQFTADIDTDPIWTTWPGSQLASGKNTSIGTTWYDGPDLTPRIDVLDELGTTDSLTKVAVIVVEIAAAFESGDGGGGDPSVVSAVWADTSTGSLSTYTLDGGSPFTPAADCGYLLTVDSAVLSGTPAPATIGNGTTGLSFVRVASQQFDSTPVRLLSLYASAPASSPASGSLSASFAGVAQQYCLAQLFKVENPGTDGDYGAGMLAQPAGSDSDPNAVGTFATSLPMPLGDGSVAFAVFSAGLNGQLTPMDPGWTELADTTLASGKNITQTAQWRNDNTDQATGVTVLTVPGVATSAKVAGIIVELVSGASGATDSESDSESITLDIDGDIAWYGLDAELIDLLDDATVEQTTPPPSNPEPPAGASRPSSRIPKVNLIVEVRDETLAKVGQIIDFQQLTMVLRYQDISNMVMVVPGNSPMALYLTQPRAGIVIRRDGQVIFSGPVAQWKRYINEGVELLQVSGPDDSYILRSLAYPQPELAGTPPWTDAYDVRTGPGETIIYEYLDANLGAAAVPARQWPNLTLGVDGGRGFTTEAGGQITERARFQTLLELFQRIAAATIHGLGWSVRQLGPELRFEVYQPADRSPEAVFSVALGNVAAYSLESVAPTATHVVVGGQGEEAARLFVERTATGQLPDWGRIEAFKDRRDIDDADELGAAADTELAEARPKLLLTIDPIDTLSLRYGRDFQVGDLVAGVIPGQTGPGADNTTYAAGGDTYAELFYGDTYSTFGTRPTRPRPIRIVDVVRQVTLTYGPDGPAELVQVVIGTNGDAPLDIYTRLSATEAATNHLNRR